MSRKILIGKIVATNQTNTAKVLVKRLKKHQKYHKQYTISKNYLVHNPENKYKIGQEVSIIETKPISKKKHFIIKEETK